jgi:hypothetical protein
MRFRGSFTNSRRMKSETSRPRKSGMGGSAVRMRLEISCWVFFSPSTVKGEAPVSSS